PVRTSRASPEPRIPRERDWARFSPRRQPFSVRQRGENMRRPLPSWGREVTRPMRTRTLAMAGLHLLLWSVALVLAHILIGAPWPMVGELALAQLVLFLAVKV